MNLIVAVDENLGIGCNGDLLMRVPEDMELFRSITFGKVVVMGHSTFMSLPQKKPLKGRVNIILSKDSTIAIEGAFVCNTLPDLFKICSMYFSEDIYVIGGQTIYEQLLPYCANAYVTKLWPSLKKADRFFPDLDSDPNWSLTERSEVKEYNGLSYSFHRYVNLRVSNGNEMYTSELLASKVLTDAFIPKSEALLFIPNGIDRSERYDSFCVELLDLAAAFISPLEFGIRGVDLIDYYNNFESKGMSLYSFLLFQRYIATTNEFVDLFIKYGRRSAGLVRGYEIRIKNDSLKEFRNRLYDQSSLASVIDYYHGRSVVYDVLRREWRG